MEHPGAEGGDVGKGGGGGGGERVGGCPDKQLRGIFKNVTKRPDKCRAKRARRVQVQDDTSN